MLFHDCRYYVHGHLESFELTIELVFIINFHTIILQHYYAFYGQKYQLMQVIIASLFHFLISYNNKIYHHCLATKRFFAMVFLMAFSFSIESILWRYKEILPSAAINYSMIGGWISSSGWWWACHKIDTCARYLLKLCALVLGSAKCLIWVFVLWWNWWVMSWSWSSLVWFVVFIHHLDCAWSKTIMTSAP